MDAGRSSSSVAGSSCGDCAPAEVGYRYSIVKSSVAEPKPEPVEPKLLET